jgi:hypothetical protein
MRDNEGLRADVELFQQLLDMNASETQMQSVLRCGSQHELKSFWLSQMEACRKERPRLLSHANIAGAPDAILGVINDGDTEGTFAHHCPSPERSAPGPVVQSYIVRKERN